MSLPALSARSLLFIANRLLREVPAVLALVLLPVGAALVGVRGPLRIALNLGPGDSPYISGFTPHYEIVDKVATHWTTYQAEVHLPLTVRGGPAELSYRFARVLPETAVVEVHFGGRLVDRFTCRGGVFLERKASLVAPSGTPVIVSFKVDSHDRRDLGLKLDWIRLDIGKGARASLQGFALWRPAIMVALLVLFLRWAGWGIRPAFLLTAPWALASAISLLLHPWITHRLLTGIPIALAGLGLAGLGVGQILLRRGRTTVESLRSVFALVVIAFLLRALAMSHPDFYYPDLRTHALMVEWMREAGLDFLLSPSQYISKHGVWVTGAYGRSYAFPYSPAFHLPFALSPLGYDNLLTAMKLGAAAVSTAPLVVVWALARRLGAPTWGALLMIFIPSYTSRLSFAFLPALFGHAVDMGFLYWLSGHLDRIGSLRVWAAGAVWVVACQLAYVSGAINIGVLIVVLAVLDSLGRRQSRLGHALAILGLGIAGSLVSVLIYYRDFLPMIWDLLPRMLEGLAGASSRYPVQGWLEVSYSRTRDFFDGVYPVLAAAGLLLMFRRGVSRPLLLSWVATYFLLLLGRAKIPDIFLHGHETLFLTPLVALAAGDTLGFLAASGRWRRWLAAGLLVALGVQGLVLQWQFLAEQLRNAL